MGINFFYMFVVLEILNIIYDATNITKQTETKIRGRRTVASTAVLSRHRFGISSSDLPSLFNFNLFIMLEKGQRNGSKNVATCNGDELPVNEIRNLHADSRQSVINDLFNRPINQLVNDFMVEMDAKNKAYYFILESGMFMQFRDYCLTNQNRG